MAPLYMMSIKPGVMVNIDIFTKYHGMSWAYVTSLLTRERDVKLDVVDWLQVLICQCRLFMPDDKVFVSSVFEELLSPSWS
uniref:Uncharacterized protein n=1 Tax=Pararge aegeria TaxID=116150 RepID=S4P506_9NEOP